MSLTRSESWAGDAVPIRAWSALSVDCNASITFQFLVRKSYAGWAETEENDQLF